MFIRQFTAGVHPVFTRRFSVHTRRTLFELSRVLFQSSRSNIHSGITTDISVIRHNARSRRSSLPFLFTATGVVGVGLGLSAFNHPTIYCDGESHKFYIARLYSLFTSTEGSTIKNDYAAHTPGHLPSPPTSSVNFYELSFGTVCGLCAGVFIKKGAKALAFFFGGVFVLLQVCQLCSTPYIHIAESSQYLGSSSIIRVDWGKIASRFENVIYTEDPITHHKKAPNVYSLWNWVVDFLTANFQQRASFVAGFVLGLRVG